MKILLVDDDSSIIQALLPALKTLAGHEVHVALSAEKALERAPAVGGVDLLITDIVMQAMDGFSLREQLQAWYPGLRTIFISGYDLSEYTERIRGAQLLAKPFGPDDLMALVRATIHAANAAPAPAEAAVVETVVEEHTPEQIAAPEPAPAVVEPEPVEAETASFVVEEAVEPAAPESAPPAASEVQGELNLAAESIETPLPVAAVPEPEPVVPIPEPEAPAAVSEPAPLPVEEALTPEAAPAPEPEPAPVAAATPVAVPARPIAVKPTSRPVSSIQPVPAALRPTARPASAAPAPIATPKAVASPRATAVPGSLMAPVARPVAATPAAVPVAKAAAAAPAAVPTVKPMAAVPVARPVAPTSSPIPTARPVAATPSAVPVAKAAAPTPLPVPTAKPAPAKPVAAKPGTPVARPAAAAPASPVARPMAPTAAAVPTARAASAAAVTIRATAAPRAPSAPSSPVRATAAPVVPSVVPPPPKRESHSSAANLIGQNIGGYQIVSQLGEGRWGPVFAAVQTSINRPVGLKILDPVHVADEAQRQRFIADARAKAHVQHPGILSVYEAGSADGWTFYTQEYVDGQNLEEMAATGHKVDEPTALRLLKTAADGLAYFAKSNIPHTPFEPSDIYLAPDGQPRLANLATQLADQPTSVSEEIESLGRALLAVIDAGPDISTALRALLGRTLRTNHTSFKDWAAVLAAVKALEPKVIPLDAAKISAQERAALATVEKARKQQKRAFMMNVIALISLLVIAVVAVYFVWIHTNERVLDEQIHIPAGEFFSGEGKPSTTGEFWIDKYEVTIGEYANFVRWIDQNVGDQHSFDHRLQPRQLSHIPEYWQIYYGQARKGGAAHQSPITLNSPMMMVTWWDAYAYARWKGRDLPTELEWEKAARGEKGFKFPWGEEPDAKRANTNADFNETNPKAKATVDGFNYWGDVDEQTKDKSPYGVIGMAGNVSEWTVDLAEAKFPIIKGGNFKIGLQPMSARIANQLPGYQDESVGFRTISRTDPSKPK